MIAANRLTKIAIKAEEMGKFDTDRNPNTMGFANIVGPSGVSSGGISVRSYYSPEAAELNKKVKKWKGKYDTWKDRYDSVNRILDPDTRASELFQKGIDWGTSAAAKALGVEASVITGHPYFTYHKVHFELLKKILDLSSKIENSRKMFSEAIKIGSDIQVTADNVVKEFNYIYSYPGGDARYELRELANKIQFHSEAPDKVLVYDTPAFAKMVDRSLFNLLNLSDTVEIEYYGTRQQLRDKMADKVRPMARLVYRDAAAIQNYYALLVVDLGRMHGGVQKAMAKLEKMTKKGNKFAEQEQMWMRYDLEVSGNPLGDAKSAVKKVRKVVREFVRKADKMDRGQRFW